MVASVENSLTDQDYMEIALKEASKGIYTTSPNPAVGCVLVRNGKIIGSGYHHKAGQPHAEVMAMHDAHDDIKGATAYVTLEPCSHYGRTPPCAKTLREAGVSRVVIAIADPNPLVSGRGMRMLQEGGVEVELGMLEHQAFELNRAFFKSISQQRPFVILKYGMSMDGKIALSNGESKWITNDECRSDVQHLRAWSDAMLTSAKTLRADNARLNVRYDELPDSIKEYLKPDQVKQPLKIVLDSHNTFTDEELNKYAAFDSGTSYIIHGTHEPILVDKAPCNFKIERERKPGVFGVAVPFYREASGEWHVDLKAVLDFLNSLQVRVVMIEAGAVLGASFMTQDLVDECYCYIAPKFLGANAKAAFMLPEPDRLAEALHFDCSNVAMIGDNVRITLQSNHVRELERQIVEKVI